MKAFVTGGTGFIGKHIVERLVMHGYAVTCLVRQPHKADELRKLGATITPGDITDRESMRKGMTGADIVFHCAGWYEIGVSRHAAELMEKVNVSGTENALGLAVELGIPKIVYTSTTAVFGNTYGIVVDESYQRNSPFESAYDRTKYQAHAVAEHHIAQGAPIIIVMPAGVYGPGDHSMVATMVRLLLRRMVPILPGADTGHSFVYVEDVAEGHVLAAEKGRIGQSYILGGDVLTLGDVLQVVGRLAGVPAPFLYAGASIVAPLKPIVALLEKFMALPPMMSTETLSFLGTTWWVSSKKAEQELGYTHRSIEEGMAETVSHEVVLLHNQPAFMQTHFLLILAGLTLWLGMVLIRARRRRI
jgi:dihydroflavonol-4-reductase